CVLLLFSRSAVFFFFHAPVPTPIYTLSLHDALPIYIRSTIITRLGACLMLLNSKVKWYQKFPITKKLIKKIEIDLVNAGYAACECGAGISNARIVMMIANTPSLKALRCSIIFS